MKNGLRTIQPWIAFAGFVLIVMVLYWAQAILVPFALALLFTFLLSPLVTPLQRFIGRAAAVLIVVVLVSGLLGMAAWSFAHQFTSLAQELPRYRVNIRQKIADVRAAGKGTTVEKVQETLSEVKEEMAKGEAPKGTTAQPVVVTSQQTEGLLSLSTWLGPLLEPLAIAALVFVLVIFMLLEWQDLRNRVIGLFDHGHLAVATKALDEAATRVSRYLLMQSLTNLIFGIGVGVGLHFIGVPYALLWAVLAALLRFIPYIGPWIGAGMPLLVSLAATPGWTKPLYVLGLFVGAELITNLVIETVLYAGAAGVSQVALIVAVAFWTWLWGPLGLLMATPLTVCVVVLGKHIPGLEFLTTLMADTPALPPDVTFYQRLLARDQSEALEILEQHVAASSADQVFDELLIPALNYAERDRLEGRLSVEEEEKVIAATRELVSDAAAVLQAPKIEGLPPIFAYPVSGSADHLALEMLSRLLPGANVEIASNSLMASDMIDLLRVRQIGILCIADLPPSAPSRSRYMTRKVRAALPNLIIAVGRWAPAAVADESHQALLDSGASHVSSKLRETADHLRRAAQHANTVSAVPAPAVRSR